MKSLSLILLLLLFASCNIYKIPHPKNPGKYKTFTEKDSMIGDLNSLRSCYDVKFYELDLSFEAPKRFVSGTVQIYFNVLESTSKIQIDLAENMIIESIKWNNNKNQDLAFSRKESSVYITFDAALNAGSNQRISISYHGKPQVAKRPPWRGGFVCKRAKGDPYMGVACEDDGAHIWWPLKDHISDKPDSCQMSFTVKKGLTAIGNGRLIEEEDLGELTKFTWRTSYPINTYNVTFYIGNYVHFSDHYKGDHEAFELNYYVLPHHLEKAKKQFKQVDKILKVYEKYFGPYPWPIDGYKLVESPYEGMEHQTAIAYGSGYKEEKWRGYDYIILHETAHEWWGNAITNCDMADLWIHEGFATYAEMLYEEELFGKNTYLLSYYINRKYSAYKRPIAGPEKVGYTNFKDNDIYTKGAAVLANLRYTLNDDRMFFEIIYEFSMENRNHCVSTTDFMQLVNEKTGKNYDWYFEQYIYRREAPVFEFYYVDADGKDLLYYRWDKTATNANFKLPVKIIVLDENFTLLPTLETQVIELPEANYFNNITEQFIRTKENKTLAQ